MIRKLLLNSFLFIGIYCFPQVGINSNEPYALLDISSTNPNSPTAKDGLIIPKVNELPQFGTEKSQLLFLENHQSLQDHFYYWDGEAWQTFLDGFDRKVDDAVYVVQGTGYTNPNNTIKTVNLTSIHANNINGFHVDNNTLTVGKKGLYLIDFSSSLKKTGTPVNRATYRFSIYKNNSLIHTAETSIPNEEITATSVQTSFIQQLNLNDTFNITVEKITEVGSATFTSFGNHSLILNYLHD
ncbi:hypothetical protein [Faecalibacter sp. LW9]|uniref:hypothetical protein n=1 Tax=Faecalibacter sp. LW9 TaxID=3103144 RepID=UPI002AFF84BD|nr:hypothetical protein [Faecalibacter sp. LW9]